MAGHSAASLGARHPIHNWEYADAAARVAASGFLAADVKKIALQLDDFSLWMLTDEDPITWARKDGDGGGGGGTANDVEVSGSLGTDDTYDGIVITGRNAGATIAQWEAVYMDTTATEWLLADANGTGTYPARGLAVAAGTDGNALSVLVIGTVRNDAWNWTIGGTIYLSATAGGLTQTAPSTSGDKIQQVGFALTADIAFFDFNSTYLTVP